MNKQPAVYLLASGYNGTLYVRTTSDLIARITQHKQGVFEGFSKCYKIHNLVYFEIHDSMELAIVREKQLKQWNRAWKVNLIEKSNPYWRDLYQNLL